MSAVNAAPVPTTAPIPALREDLVVSLVTRGDRRIAVVKDPLAHLFYEMPEDDFRVAQHLDPSLTLAEMLMHLRREGPASCREADERALSRRVQRLCAELRSCGLVRGATATPRSPTTQGVLHEWQGHLRRLVGLLFLRIPVGDPSAFLEWMRPWCGIFFKPVFLVGAAIFTLVSAFVFFSAGGLSSFEPGWFASWQALLAFYGGLVLLKVIHEAAHAVAVRHYGGKVHETGMTLVAGLPLFYVEASDSYLFSKKSQRIAVAAAGIVAELFLAAVLVWPWLYMADGFGRQLVLNLLLVASVSTILFNGNPLMRFDGYYIFAEAIDMPNLRERSRQFLAELCSSALIGTARSVVGRREALLLGVYGALSQLYLIVVILGIWRFLSLVAQPQGLQWLANLLVGSWALSSLVLPFVSFCTGLAKSASASRGTAKKRALVGLLTGAAVVCVIGLVPLPHWISRSCVLEPAGNSVVRASVDGFVADVLVSEGDEVKPGEPVARLHNRALVSELAAANVEKARGDAGLRAAVANGSLADVAREKSALAAAGARLLDTQQRESLLVLSAPCSGVVATRELSNMKGKFLRAGEIFCIVQPANFDELVIPLGEKQARQVRAGAPVRLRLRSQPWKLFHGEIVGDPLRLDADQLPAGLREGSGGDVAVSPAANKTEKLLADTHFAKVRISDPDPTLKIGMTGRVQIGCGRQTVLARLAGAVADFVRLDVRMQ